MAKNNQGQEVKKDNSIKLQRTLRRKAARVAKIAAEKKKNPNLNVWRIGLKGRLLRLKKVAGTVGSDRRDLVENRIREITNLLKNGKPVEKAN